MTMITLIFSLGTSTNNYLYGLTLKNVVSPRRIKAK